MSPIKLLNHLLLLENFLGVYRNYSIQTRKSKYLIVLHIFVQAMFHSITSIGEQFWLFEGDVSDQKFYIYRYFSIPAYATSLIVGLTSICYSRDFMSYYTTVRKLSVWFKDDKKLIHSLNKIYWLSFTSILGLFTFSIGRLLEVLIEIKQNENSFLLVCVLVSHAILRVTSVFQYIMLFVLIMIVVHLFKCLNSLIIFAQKRVVCDFSSDEQCDITSEQIQGWMELYRDLVNCCDKVTLCFGRQFFLALTISISNYISMLYKIMYSTALIDNTPKSDDYKRVVSVILSYITVMVTPLVAGQMVQNQGVAFHRLLARLYNTLVIIDSRETETKLIKDFIRLIKKNKIDIKLLSKIPAGMYMLPVILALTVNYVIVMLQINHVI